MAKPLVSVLIDTYNHENFIAQAIGSALEQDFPASDREIIVVDDGSTDGTREAVHKFKPYVRLISKPNGGQASAFNAGIPECSGEIVAFLDGDDWWDRRKLASVANAFAANPSVGVVGHSITEVLADGRHRTELVREAPRFRIDSVSGARIFCFRKSFLGTSRMAFRSELLRRIGCVPESLRIQADEYLFTMGAVFSEVLLIREPLTFYRLHGGNLFQISDGDRTSLARKHLVLESLVGQLRRRFEQEGIAADVTNVVIETIKAEADMLSLALHGGSRLKKFQVEFRGYRIMHEKASLLRRFLKLMTLLPVLILSEKQSDSYRRWLASSSAYRDFRRKFFPYTRPTHVDRTGDWSSR